MTEPITGNKGKSMKRGDGKRGGKQTCGVVLYDVLVAITVIAILSAVLIPSFIGVIEYARENEARQSCQLTVKEMLSVGYSGEELSDYVFQKSGYAFRFLDGKLKETECVNSEGGYFPVTDSGYAWSAEVYRSLPICGHDCEMKYVEQIEAQCEKSGSASYWYCTECGTCYREENGKEILSEEERLLGALGHDWDEKGVCRRCGNLSPEDPVGTAGLSVILVSDGVEKFCCISGMGSAKGAIVSIPSRKQGIAVKEIATGAFKTKEIVEVRIPSSVNRIGKNAFLNCSVLKEVSFGEGLQEIGETAFSGCLSLEVIVLPGSLEKIGDGAFAFCWKLERIEFAGTEKEWSKVLLGANWCAPYVTKVICSDGEVIL